MRHEGVGTGATFDAVAVLLLLAKEIPGRAGYPRPRRSSQNTENAPHFSTSSAKHRRSVKSLCRSQYKYLLGSAS